MKDKKPNALLKVSQKIEAIQATAVQPTATENEFNPVTIPEAVQEAYKKVGAFHTAEFFRHTALALEYELITDARKKELHKKNGYPNFGLFIEKVFHISKSKANEILHLERKIGQEALISLANLGLKRKEILSITENAEGTESQIPTIIIDDEEIPLLPENKDRIQKIADTLKTKEVENQTLKQRIQELRKGQVQAESFESTMSEISMNVFQIYQPLQQLRDIAKSDPALKRLYIANLVKLDAWFTNIKSELLDENLGEMEDLENIEGTESTESTDLGV
jgi:hypothetical protein